MSFTRSSLALLALVAAFALAPLAAENAPAGIADPGAVKVDEFNDQADPAATPVDGGTLTLRFDSEPKLLSNELDNSAVTQYLTGNIYETLIEKNPETFKLEPLACERFIEEDLVLKTDGTRVRGRADESAGVVVVSPAGGDSVTLKADQIKEIRRSASLTFHMRKGATFHDGKPVTAKDVLFSYKTVANPHVLATSARSYLTDFESAELIDDMTLRFTFARQYWLALETAGNIFFIYPEHIYNADGLLEKDPKAFGERFNNHPQHRAPIGSGPYKFGEWKAGSSVTLTRYQPYNGRIKPRLEKLVYRFIPDNVAALQALKNGEVDFVPELTPEQYEEHLKNAEFRKKFVLTLYYYPNYNYVGWNCRKVPFNDKRVRLAMAHCSLDKKLFAKEILYGRALVVEGDQYIYGPAYDPSVQPPAYDPEKAEEILAEAGWFDHDNDGLRDKDGVPFKFEMLMPQQESSAPASRRAAIMIDNLKKMGIEMTVRMLEWGSFIQRVEKGDFDACQLGWALSPEDDPYQSWHSSQSGEGGSNHCGFINQEADKLIEASRSEIDPTRRRALFFKLQALLHDEQPYNFLFCSPEYMAYAKKFRGVKIYKLRPGYDLRGWWESR